jgi:hypothetical protein
MRARFGRIAARNPSTASFTIVPALPNAELTIFSASASVTRPLLSSTSEYSYASPAISPTRRSGWAFRFSIIGVVLERAFEPLSPSLLSATLSRRTGLRPISSSPSAPLHHGDRIVREDNNSANHPSPLLAQPRSKQTEQAADCNKACLHGEARLVGRLSHHNLR